MSAPSDKRICANCSKWGEMGLCRAQSGYRSEGGIRWHQTVTTEHSDTCAMFATFAASPALHEGEGRI